MVLKDRADGTQRAVYVGCCHIENTPLPLIVAGLAYAVFPAPDLHSLTAAAACLYPFCPECRSLLLVECLQSCFHHYTPSRIVSETLVYCPTLELIVAHSTPFCHALFYLTVTERVIFLQIPCFSHCNKKIGDRHDCTDPRMLVENTGLEPVTPCTSSRCSSQLS